jgi:3-deoxy-D-manno-octulosonic-acid transferase
MARILYTILLISLLPWALLHLVWRSRRQPEYLRHWGERFGFYSDRPGQPVIWIHAVSVGETRAAQPLVAALRARYPEHGIVFSHMTPTGRQTSITLFGDTVGRVYLPYDTPWAVARFLSHFRPTLGLIMETELWPNLVNACRNHDIPLLLVNARLSERSARRYGRWKALSRPTLLSLSTIAAQGEGDARRLRGIGASEVAVLGNMKFDIDPPPAQLALGTELRAKLDGRAMFLCASTREGEEAAILDAWPRDTDVLLAIVPRHPQRFDEVAALIAAKGFSSLRRSGGETPGATTQVWLGDSMGELFAWYEAADAAFVGGSLLNYGSQNLIEACAVGTPILLGPSTFNFADAAREAIAAGAAIQVANAQELVRSALSLIGEPSRRTAMADFGRSFATRHRGATARTMALIEQVTPARR